MRFSQYLKEEEERLLTESLIATFGVGIASLLIGARGAWNAGKHADMSDPDDLRVVRKYLSDFVKGSVSPGRVFSKEDRAYLKREAKGAIQKINKMIGRE